ncbi:MAG: hypothetical protein WC728_16465 [Elusimicrobiota bacterium]
MGFGRAVIIGSLLLFASGNVFCQDEEPTGKARRAGAEKSERRPLKKPPKDKESKYISPGKELGGPFRFDEYGRPLKGTSDEKGEQAREEGKDNPKKVKWPRKPGKRRPGSKPKREKPAPTEPAEESGEETPGETEEETPPETPPEAEKPEEPPAEPPAEPPPESPPEENPE